MLPLKNYHNQGIIFFVIPRYMKIIALTES